VQPAPLRCGTRSQVKEKEEALRERIKCG